MPCMNLCSQYALTFFKQCSAAIGIVYTSSVPCIREGLAGETGKENIVIWDVISINCPYVLQQAVSTICC